MCYTEDLTLTSEKAKQRNLDVYNFSPRTVLQRLEFAATMCKEREVILFTEQVAGFTLLAVAVGPRREAGQIAKAMKASK